MAHDVAEGVGLWSMMRAATPARIGLPRTGLAVATPASLAFQLAHAEARDAVHERVDFDSLDESLRRHGLQTVCVSSSAKDRRAYLLRPDHGRKLDEASSSRLARLSGQYDLLFVIADGLSARAVISHAAPMLDAALAELPKSSWKFGPLVLVENGRVAIGDEIGQILGAALVAVLIGERPGLTSPDSLGIYLTFAPRVGCTDAERNCLSNIRLQGMSYADAARRLAYLCREARRRKLTGVQLKDEASCFEPSAETPSLPRPA